MHPMRARKLFKTMADRFEKNVVSNNTIIKKVYNTTLSPLDRSTRLKINWDQRKKWKRGPS